MSLPLVYAYLAPIEFLTNSPQNKNATIEKFISAVPSEIACSKEFTTLKYNYLIATDLSYILTSNGVNE